MYKAVLFDMDGVLFDTERMYMKADNLVLAKMGLELPQEVQNSLCGVNEQVTRRAFLDCFGERFDFDAFHTCTHALMDRWITEGRAKKKPGLDKALLWLKENGIPAAVATSSGAEITGAILRSAGLERAFAAVITSGQVSRSKPWPDTYLAAARALNTPPASCVAVEDSYNGIRSAAAAGCTAVMIPDVLPPTEDIRPLCGAILNSLEQLPGFIQFG